MGRGGVFICLARFRNVIFFHFFSKHAIIEKIDRPLMCLRMRDVFHQELSNSPEKLLLGTAEARPPSL